MVQATQGIKIYTASKTKHAQKWRDLRASGHNVISTWIDEAGEGESSDLHSLCQRCINECEGCDAMIVYREDGDYLKGAFIEMGIALTGRFRPIVLVGPVLPPGSAFTKNNRIFLSTSIKGAIRLINNYYNP